MTMVSSPSQFCKPLLRALPLTLLLSACGTMTAGPQPGTSSPAEASAEKPTSAPQTQPLPADTQGQDAAGPSKASTPHQTPAAVTQLIRRAEGEFREGRLGDAEATLERALRIDPNHPVLWSNLGTLRLEQGNAREAVGLFARSNRLAGQEARLRVYNWQMIAEGRAVLGDRAGSKRALEKARKLAGK